MCKQVPQIGLDSEALTLSADSNFLYLSHEGGIVTFARNGDGTLAFRSCLNDGGTARLRQELEHHRPLVPGRRAPTARISWWRTRARRKA